MKKGRMKEGEVSNVKLPVSCRGKKYLKVEELNGYSFKCRHTSAYIDNCLDERDLRKGVGKLHFIWQDAPELRFATKKVAAHQCEGTQVTISKLKQLLRFLQGVRDDWLFLTLPKESD